MSSLYTCLCRIFYKQTDFAEEWPWCCWVHDECPIDLINGYDAGNSSKKACWLNAPAYWLNCRNTSLEYKPKCAALIHINTYQESLQSRHYKQWTVVCCIMRNCYSTRLTHLGAPPSPPRKWYGERRDGRKIGNEKDREIQYVVKRL